MPTVGDIEQMLYAWAPRELAAPWDNVGLLVGDRAAHISRVIVALDITEAVVAEAIEKGAELIIAHHPVMNCKWHAVQHIVPEDVQGRILTALLKNGVAAICMHTNLDAASGGVNDCLAAALGLRDVYAPEGDGIIRVGTFTDGTLRDFLRICRDNLHASGLRYRDAGKAVRRVAVGGGACGDYIEQVIGLGCDTFVTADLSYHRFLDTTALNLIDAGHFPTEDMICEKIVEHIAQAYPALKTEKSISHGDCIQYYM